MWMARYGADCSDRPTSGSSSAVQRCPVAWIFLRVVDSLLICFSNSYESASRFCAYCSWRWSTSSPISSSVSAIAFIQSAFTHTNV